MSQSIDIDVTYYMGSNWEVPTDSIIPSHDIPVLDYNAENKMSSPPGTLTRFVDVLEQNLTQLIDFCSQLTSSQRPTTVEHSPVPYRHYHRRIANYLSQTESATE